MQLLTIPFPAIDPVIFKIGFLSVRWYGLAYLVGLGLAWAYMRGLTRNGALWPGKPPLEAQHADDFLLWATLGTVIGGRLGFVLFYEPGIFLSQPWRVFMLNEGGMAFHGGLLGVGAAIWMFCRVNKIPLLSMMDVAAAAVPFGLLFGRIANFINGEIYGRLTDVPWAVNFPARVMLPGDMPGPRHATQIYEAFLEGIVMFALLRVLTHRLGAFKRPGLTAGAFLMVYALFRIFVEYFKEWDMRQFFTTAYFSEGMVYSLPMLALGIYLWRRTTKPAGEIAA
jgi:phosphatidylglycerol:prolipoprotein diacylglycerol transferase